MKTRTSDQERTDVEIGRRIKSRRLVLGMTQAELAEGLGVSFQQVQKYEKGTNRLSGGRLLQLCEKLDMPVALLLDRLGTAPSKRTTVSDFLEEFCADRTGVELARAFMSIASPVQRQAALEVVRTLASAGERRRSGSLRHAG